MDITALEGRTCAAWLDSHRIRAQVPIKLNMPLEPLLEVP